MSKPRKATFSQNGYEINNGYRIRKIDAASACSYYQVDLGDTSGNRVQKNFSNANKARLYANRSKIQANQSGVKSIQLTDPRQLDAVEALKMLRPFNTNLGEAAHFYESHHRAIDPADTIGALIEQFIAEKKKRIEHGELPSSALINTRKFLKRFSKEFGQLAPDMVSIGEIDYFLQKVNGAENRRSHRLYISALFDWLVAQERLPSNPVKKTRYAPRNTQTPKTYRPSEVERIMQAAPLKLVPYLALGLFGGLRSEEILNLRWCDVDFGQEKISVDASSKKGMARTVQMPANLAQFLLPFRDKPKAMIVPHGQRSLQRWSKKLLGELGIKTILHGARHSFAAFHLALHPLDETMQELGYADRTILLKYCRGSADNRKELAKEYFAIAPLNQGEIISLEAA